MKQIRLLFATLLAVLTSTTAWANIYKDPSTNVEYEYSLDYTNASVKAGEGVESDVFPAHEGLTGNIVILESFTAGNGLTYTVTDIGQGAFMHNEGITSITIPKTITYIDRAAFYGCTGLNSIYCYANPSKLSWQIIDFYPEGKDNKATVFHVPSNYLNKYKSRFSEANVTFKGDLPATDGTEEVSIKSTFIGWRNVSSSDTQKVGTMLTDEYHDWTAYLPSSSTEARFTSVTNHSGTVEKSIQIGGSNEEDISFYISNINMFDVSGTIKKIIVRASGNLSSLHGQIHDPSLEFTERKDLPNLQNDGSFKDYTLKFNGEIEYNHALITLNFDGSTPIFIQSITIVQEEAAEEGPATSGKTGNLSWKVEEIGTVMLWENGTNVEKPAYRLTISGNGEMPDYKDTGYDQENRRAIFDMPWYPFTTIQEVVIEEGVKNVGGFAFRCFPVLNEIKLPLNIERIGERIVDDFSSIKIMNFPEGLKSIAEYALPWCIYLKEVHLPSTLTELSPISFKGNKIENLTIAEGSKMFDARDNCNAIILTAENKVFMGTPYMVVPASVTSIGENAFTNNLNLASFTIPDHVTTICKKAFSDCSSTKTLSIGTASSSCGLTAIAEKAFDGCNKMEDVYCYANPSTLTWEGYDNEKNFKSDKGTKFHVPASYLATWQSKFPNLNATLVGDLEGGPVTVIPAEEEGVEAGKAVTTESGVTISLGADDIIDKEDGSVTVKTTLTPDEVKELLKGAMPDDPNFYGKFKGIYSYMSAGSGVMEVTFETLGDYELTMMTSSGKVETYTKDTKGTITITYEDNEWVFIFASLPAAARAKMGRAAIEGGLKIYSVKFIPGGAIPGDANNDGTVNAADIVEVVNYIMATPSDNYN
ncbi:MAG: leucine-rich repeat protein [Prevotella sp.]|nr:leucine-rich repeat protein [Prevotella sp.]